MTTAIYNKITGVILLLLVVVTIPFEIDAVKKWAEEYENLKLLLSILRPLVAFTCLYFGIFSYICGKRLKNNFKGAVSLIVLGAVYSLGYVAEVLIFSYFQHRFRAILLPTTASIKTNTMITALNKTDTMITAANIYLTVVAFIFLAVTAFFIIMLKKINTTNATEQPNRGDRE